MRNIGIFGSGIRLLSGCSGIYIASNLITNNLGGVHVEDADNNSIVNNLIAYNRMVPSSYTGDGIDFYQSDNNTVSALGEERGIKLYRFSSSHAVVFQRARRSIPFRRYSE